MRHSKLIAKKDDGTTLVVDSGQVTAFRPAQHRKPAGMLRRVTQKVLSALGWVAPEDTSEQGASAAASPSTYGWSLWSQRYERRQIITDCRQAQVDEPRVRKAMQKFAREAARRGCTVVMNGDVPKRLSKRAQEIADDVIALMPASKLTSWAWMAMTEGDLFIQAVLAGDRLYALKRMPASSMERLTDDADEFINPAIAFEQVDVTTNEMVAQFPLAVMFHGRWNWIDGERYGQPDLLAGRRLRRLLEVMEEGQAIRRMTRATKRTLWNIGTQEKPGKQQDVELFKELNGFTEGRREIFDPTEIPRDFFGNGLVSQEEVAGDRTIADVDDLRYMQDVYAISLPTPKAIYGLDAESINRDVLEDQRAEWLKETQTMTDMLEELVRWAVDLALLLKGILPETVGYTVKFSDSSVETPGEVVDRNIKLREANLISLEQAVQNVAEFSGVIDVEGELAKIKQEQEEQRQQDLAAQQQGMGAGGAGSSNVLSPSDVSLDGRRSAGGSELLKKVNEYSASLNGKKGSKFSWQDSDITLR